MRAKDVRLINAIRRDMQRDGTTPEYYCPRRACMACEYLNTQHAAVINKPCPLQKTKERELGAFYQGGVDV